jgi:branched-chain amino acid transport system permease protein
MMRHEALTHGPHQTIWLGRLLWGLALLALLSAPGWVQSSLHLSLLSQMGVAIIVCLSFQWLYAQAGLLSFGHALYTGVGAYAAAYALQAHASGAGGIAFVLIPLWAGGVGLLLATLLGGLTTRNGGTAFAMITLATAELAFAVALMFPQWFGGDAGISINRAWADGVGQGLPWSWGSPTAMHVLVVIYLVSVLVALRFFQGTPLGHVLRAVRDKPERLACLGYNPHRVRHAALMVAGALAGVAGGLGALLFEMVSPEVLSTSRSGSYLLFSVLGGAAPLLGPALGGVVLVLATVWLSKITQAWLLYVGLVFMVMVLVSPGGMSAWCLALVRYLKGGPSRWRLRHAALVAAWTAVCLSGTLAVEMLYHARLSHVLGDEVQVWGLWWSVRSMFPWLISGAGAALGLVAVLLLKRTQAR